MASTTRRFSPDSARAVPGDDPKAERDPTLADKLEDELSGILNWAVEGLQRLLGNGTFTGDKSPAHTRETWSKWGDSVERFANIALKQSGDKEVPKHKVYGAYLQFCREESIPRETQRKMTRELKREGFNDGRAYINGSRERCFVGINWTGRGQELLDSSRDDSDDSTPQFGGLDDF
jgi:Predicted ATPase